MSRSKTSRAVALGLLRELLESVAEEIAEVCVSSAVSSNIKERRDLSAAVFDGRGTMVAHAAHIPVHLGAMPLTVRHVLDRLVLAPGDIALANDPYAGGTHLPDVTAVAPLFAPGAKHPTFLVAVRAHHADIGGAVPGSMAPQADVFAEGIRIPPVKWIAGGVENAAFRTLLLANVRDPEERRADFDAQAASLRRGLERLEALARREDGLDVLARKARGLVGYAGRLAGAALEALPDGVGRSNVGLEVNDLSGNPARIHVLLEKRGGSLRVDFAGTSGPVGEGLNAPEAVTRSAVYYLLRCLCPTDTPTNDGLLRAVEIHIPAGSLLSAELPHPVAGGNVETSQRVVDGLWLAAADLWPGRMPAPGAGTMSNWTFGPVAGGKAFPTYYETLPAGAGGGPGGAGASAIQQHMTNTRSTPVEVLEARWPVSVERMAVRRGTGGGGRHPGGEGLLKEIRFLEAAVVGALMTHHVEAPRGVAGGGDGAVGRLTLLRGGVASPLGPRTRVRVEPGDVLRIETPGGGGWGSDAEAGKPDSST